MNKTFVKGIQRPGRRTVEIEIPDTLVDFGVIEATDLYNGPFEIGSLPPSSDPIVIGFFYEDNTLTSTNIALTVSTELDDGYWVPTFSTITAINFAMAAIPIRPNNDTVFALMNTAASGKAVTSEPLPWVANHSYSENDLIIAGDKWWIASGGVSGVSEPDFASFPTNFDTVDDNGITWTNEGDIITGNIHIYMVLIAK